MRASIIAGGTGQRLNPITNILNKHLLLVYNKPMIFYQISFLILCGFKEFLIVVINEKMKTQILKILPKNFKKKIKISFAIQKNPNGIPGAMNLAKNFFENQDLKIFLLGDNFFYGNNLPFQIKDSLKRNKPTIFTQKVDDNSSFGVVYKNNKKINVFIEKPKTKINAPAITGLYFFDKSVFDMISNLKLSKRNEFEIINILKEYEKKNLLKIVELSQGVVWFDLGTFNNIYLCSEFVKIIEDRQGIKIGDLEGVLNLI